MRALDFVLSSTSIPVPKVCRCLNARPVDTILLLEKIGGMCVDRLWPLFSLLQRFVKAFTLHGYILELHRSLANYHCSHIPGPMADTPHGPTLPFHLFFFFFKSLFYFYWGVALCWKLKLRGVCMYVGFLCLCRCRAWSMTTRCKSRCGEVYACEANGWWCQVGCGRGGPGVVVSTIGAVGIRGGSVMYVVYIYISGRSRWVK